MSANLLKYINDNFTLCKTLVIKSLNSCNSINNDIIKNYGSSQVDLNNPYTWKYYLNLAGEYHTTDELMYVTSLDTQENILFSKNNLLIHSDTRNEYRYGTRYYYSLLNKYPKQESLILSILYPCDIIKAIESSDGTILSYPTELIEDQEQTLILDLEFFIKNFMKRWHVPGFTATDSLYEISQLAILYLNLVPKLMNLRLARCKTIEAHSFHISNYLASHGRLDRYIPYLTLKQKLFLYRNICYIERNSGKTEQFKNLIQNLLIERKIPLSEITVRHKHELDENLDSVTNIRSKPLSGLFNSPEKTYYNLEELKDKESVTVYGNPLYLADNSSYIDTKLKNSTSNVLQTKDLESNMIDYTNVVPDTLEQVVFRQWVYMTLKGLYNISVDFIDPKTSEIITLSNIDAFIYMHYLYYNSLGINIVTFPKLTNIKQRKNPKPNLNTLMTFCRKEDYDLTETISTFLTKQPVITNCYSVNNFFKLAKTLHQECLNQWFAVSNTHDVNKRASLQSAINNLYESEIYNSPIVGQNIQDWLNSKNLKAYDYTKQEAETLIENIFKSATGYVIENPESLRNIQKALIEIMKQLSSYSVQYLVEINDANINPLNWAAVRVGIDEIETFGISLVNVETRVIDQFIEQNSTHTVLVTNQGFDISNYEFKNKIVVESGLTVTSGVIPNIFISVPLNTYGVASEYTGYNPDISDNESFGYMEFFYSLTDEEKIAIKDIY